MKYGDSLHQRSIPLWENYNVDYNDIKHLIKKHTTKGQAQATTIPGRDNEVHALQKFENELFAELREQHQRIDLFVYSKSGEIDRRLVHLDKQITQLRRRNAAADNVRIPVRRLERFSKLEEATLKVGEEIQSLSRFIGAQRLAFQKLLKKYKRWTGSAELGKRFHKEILSRSTGFSKQDFGPLLIQWSEVLAAVRAPFSAGVRWQADSVQRKATEIQRLERPKTSNLRIDNINNTSKTSDENSDFPTSAAGIHSACESGSNIDVDTALAVLPLSRKAGKAAYWVHPDNIIEILVLLLQYTRLRNPVTSPNIASISPSPSSSRRGSMTGRSHAPSHKSEDEVGIIICDDLQQFAKRQSAATINDSENVPGKTAEHAAVSIRYASTSEAIVAIKTCRDSRDHGPGTREVIQKARLKKKALHELFDFNPISAQVCKGSHPDSTSTCLTETDEVQGFNSVQLWLTKHSEVRPLVQIQVKRTRFVGLGNNESDGVWATLDKDVLMRQSSFNAANNNEEFLAFNDGIQGLGLSRFPHAVLEVRYEGEKGTRLVAALDESHLTERVRGFSLETHAVATLCKPQSMPRPYWLPALDHDIRKIPTQPKPLKRGSSDSQHSPQSASTGQTSVSTASASDRPTSSDFSGPFGESSATSAPDVLESPPLSTLKKKRKLHPRKEHPLREEIIAIPHADHQRYWNEFDDGDEGSENEAYTIFVDPDSSTSFLGGGVVSNLIQHLVSKAKASTQKIKDWVNSTSIQERRPLIAHNDSSAQASAEDDSDLDNDELSPTRSRIRRHYSTFPSSHPSRHALQSRETLLLGASIASFAASLVMLLVAAILATTGRKKAAVTVDLGVVVGIIVSLIFSGMGVGATIARNDRLGWVHRSTVALLFVLDCLGCGVLAVLLGNM